MLTNKLPVHVQAEYKYLIDCVRNGALRRSQLRYAILDLVEYCVQHGYDGEVLSSWIIL